MFATLDRISGPILFGSGLTTAVGYAVDKNNGAEKGLVVFATYAIFETAIQFIQAMPALKEYKKVREFINITEFLLDLSIYILFFQKYFKEEKKRVGSIKVFVLMVMAAASGGMVAHFILNPNG
jgi:hypothetical protein